MKIQVDLTDKQEKQFKAWEAEQDKICLEKQLAQMSEEDKLVLTNDGESPYYGAIGGSITWMITRTSLGFIIKVRHAGTEETINLTDYENW